jgi:ketosteroid isomerase-like protein
VTSGLEETTMTDTQTSAADIVDRFFGALFTGDQATCQALFHDDGVVWHNYDQVEQPKNDALAALAGVAALNPQFELVGRDVIADGLVQRHVIHIALPQGGKVSIFAVQRIAISDGRISRIDEYMDSAQLGAAMQALQAG